MKQKVWIELNSHPGDPPRKIDLKPEKEAESCEVPGVKCPCGAEPLRVSGAGKHIHDHSHYTADAVCIRCDAHVGALFAEVSTLFGLKEDEEVMRFYGVKIY